MKVLGLDTATQTAGIALVEARGDQAIVLGAARRDTRGRGADLLVAIDQVCRDAGVAPAALDAIAIGAGPGSFTGLRIGMATAKGCDRCGTRFAGTPNGSSPIRVDG